MPFAINASKFYSEFQVFNPIDIAKVHPMDKCGVKRGGYQLGYGRARISSIGHEPGVEGIDLA